MGGGSDYLESQKGLGFYRDEQNIIHIMTEGIEITAVGNFVHVTATGKLSKESYHEFAPVLDEQIKTNGKLRLLFEMRDFHGWTIGGAWEDLKFDIKHWRDLERLAIVGESKWEAGMAAFCKPFTSAKVKYFDQSDLEEARGWIVAE